jgi:hypothetical protein
LKSAPVWSGFERSGAVTGWQSFSHQQGKDVSTVRIAPGQERVSNPGSGTRGSPANRWVFVFLEALKASLKASE